MKKINSLHFGLPLIAMIFVWMAVIPALCHIAYSFLGLGWIAWTGILSFGVGAVLLAVFLLIGWIEWKQDRYVNRYHAAHTHVKHKLADHRWECQHCGFCHLSQEDKRCPVCSIRFEEEAGKGEPPSKWFLR